jgi:membrane-anchored mycosin MYCP
MAVVRDQVSCVARAVLAVCLAAGGMLVVSAPAWADFKQPADAWHPGLLHLADAHRVSKGDGMTVALLDGAVAAHLDLAGAVLPGQRFTSGGEEKQWAGTSAAGLIAARGDGKTGLLGVAPGAKILPVQVRQDSKSDPIDLAKGIDWAVSQGAKVISISYPTFDLPDQLRQAVRAAVAADAVVVTASQGFTPAKRTSLASLPGVVSVGSIGRDGKPGSGRASGGDLNLDLVAPGDKLLTTIVTSLQNNGWSRRRRPARSAAATDGAPLTRCPRSPPTWPQ